MMTDSEANKSLDQDELEFNEQDLEVVEISDDGLKIADQEKKSAEVEAKKTAKKLLTADEKRSLRKKQILIVGAVLLVWLLVMLVIPATRWPLANFAGLRRDLQFVAVDQANQKPLYKAQVRLDDGSVGSTNREGLVQFNNARLGKRQAVITKPGYADALVDITNSYGSKAQPAELKAIGIKIDVDVKDWLSGKVIEGITVTAGESTAISDTTGRATLIVPPTDAQELELTLQGANYLQKQTTVDINSSSREVLLVSSAKNYFLSKRDGKYDIFSSNLDGSNQQKIIEATGKEDEAVLQFSINRNNRQAILVATRDGKVQNGRIVAGIYIVDLEKATLKKIDEGSDIQLLDWSEDTITYTKSIAALAYDDPAFARLASYNALNNKLSELASANYFGVAIQASNKVFYLPADAYRPAEASTLTSIDITNGAKKTYLADKQPRYICRASYGTLEIQDAAGNNYELQINSGTTKLIDRRPSASLSVALSGSGQRAAWTDRRDGQGVVVLRTLNTSEEKTVIKAGGLSAPVRFLNEDLLVARVVTTQETADYVISIASGKIAKIVDVSNVSSGSGAGL